MRNQMTPSATPLPSPVPLSHLDTPALLVDLDQLEGNLQRMATALSQMGSTIRPHFKAHRMPEICRRQVALGAHGITCAKLGEAEVLGALGFDHLLVANEVVGPVKWRRLAQLALRRDVLVGIDCLEVAEATAAAAREAGSQVGVLVDVNIGMDRCGIAPGPAAVELAERCAELRGLRFQGVMGYEGQVVMLSPADKVAAGRIALSKLTDTAEQCRAAGLPVQIVSAGGTGCWDITATHRGITELQCGTYSMMDLLFREGAGARDFEYACTVMGTVISRPAPDRAVTDVGKKGLHPSFGMARPLDLPGAELLALHSEHGILNVQDEARGLKVGDPVRFIPSYLEGTVNLYDRAYAIRNGLAVEEWTITGRGRSQ
jgi:D-serine deaminase-like pyridoxal phosphate-dependent protein